MAQALSAALLHFVWQGLLVAFLVWIALFIMKNRSANARYAASSAALALLALLPAATAWMLYRPPAAAAAAAKFVERAGTVVTAGPSVPGAASPWMLAWILPVWAAGVLVFALRLAWGCRQVAALRRTGEPVPDAVAAMAAALRARLGLTRTVSIVITGQSDGPSVVGWLRPAILVPAATLLGLTEQQLEAVLAHELAHIRRHDYLVNLVQNLVETLLFYHPAVWWVSSRMRHERELCCDDLAVRSCGDALCYARALTRLEKMRTGGVALALGSTGGSLLYRIQRLMGLQPRETLPSRLPAIAAVVLGVACLALNMNWAHAQQTIAVRANESMESIEGNDGPGVQVDLSGATVLERPGVEYPGSAWEHQIGGLVIVEATLDADGGVNDARILSGPVELRKAALQSILQWRFAPAAAGSTRQISIHFQWEQAQKSRENAAMRRVTVNGKGYAFLVPEESGAKVGHIEFSGLTEQQQKQVADRLGVHVGDTVMHGQVFELIKVLSTLDPPMVLRFAPDADNRVTLRIFPDDRR